MSPQIKALANFSTFKLSSMKDYGGFFTSHIPWQIYPSGEKVSSKTDAVDSMNSKTEIHGSKSPRTDEFTKRF
jgi:hypothetical protein